MEFLLSNFSIRINSKIFIKDPESSPLGRNILKASVDMIEEIGFEEFTFRKLSQAISSTEASIYRYFENKHKLLMYLASWYWAWVEYKLLFKNANINSATARLQNAISILANLDENYVKYQWIDINKLYNIIITESSKAYLIKDVDVLNKHGVFFNYKKIVAQISDIITEVNPEYKYPRMLTTTMIEGIHHQLFFAAHLPSLTDKMPGNESIASFYTELIFSQLNKEI